MQHLYAVRRGCNPGIYTNSEFASQQINCFQGIAEWCAFSSFDEARAYMDQGI